MDARAVSKSERLKCTTDRSMGATSELDSCRFKHKLEIEKELAEVNLSIINLNSKYAAKINKLQEIKDEINNLLKKKKDTATKQ